MQNIDIRRYVCVQRKPEKKDIGLIFIKTSYLSIYQATVDRDRPILATFLEFEP